MILEHPNKELLAKIINPTLPCRSSDLCFNFAPILDYLDPALNNMALEAVLSAFRNIPTGHIYTGCLTVTRQEALEVNSPASQVTLSEIIFPVLLPRLL